MLPSPELKPLLAYRRSSPNYLNWQKDIADGFRGPAVGGLIQELFSKSIMTGCRDKFMATAQIQEALPDGACLDDC